MALFAIPFPAIDPVALDFGPVTVRWYGLAYMAGILLGWFYATRLVKNDRLWDGMPPLTRSQVDDFLIWVAIGIIVGGRLGFVLFYNPVYFFFRPWEIVMLWQGGMSFHGGLIGVVLAIYLFSRRRGIKLLSMGDLVCAVVPIGLFFGRIANFINAEIYGKVTTMPWGVVFPGAGPLPRHPTQLYEAFLEGILLFSILAILIYAYQGFKRPGLVSGVFLAGYGVMRILVEFVRIPNENLGYLLGPLTMGMLLSLPMVVIGGLLIMHARRQTAPA